MVTRETTSPTPPTGTFNPAPFRARAADLMTEGIAIARALGRHLDACRTFERAIETAVPFARGDFDQEPDFLACQEQTGLYELGDVHAHMTNRLMDVNGGVPCIDPTIEDLERLRNDLSGVQNCTTESVTRADGEFDPASYRAKALPLIDRAIPAAETLWAVIDALDALDRSFYANAPAELVDRMDPSDLDELYAVTGLGVIWDIVTLIQNKIIDFTSTEPGDTNPTIEQVTAERDRVAALDQR